MELNKLSYFAEEEQEESTFPGLWIELLIDGKPVDYLAENDCRMIPQFYFENSENDLPKLSGYQNANIHLFGVCSCGFSGCGMVFCEINKANDLVNLKINAPDNYKSSENYQFTFSRENYDAVIGEVKKQIKEYNEGKISLR